MKLVQVPLVEASDDQLRWFGENVKGLDMSGLKTRTKIMGALGPVLDEDTIRVPEADEGSAVVEQDERPVVAVDAANDFSSVMQAPTITVKLLTNGAAINGKDNVWACFGNRGLQFARNVPVKMPYPYFEIIQHAVSGAVTQDGDNEMVETEVHNYPYQVLEPVDPAALAAFRAATDGLFLTQ